MRLIAVSRVLNEDDIIEAFVRHHAPLVDHHVMLDNGSNDRTIEILRALKQEGARITVLQNRAPMFTESRYNTGLFRLAAGRFAANWVLFLDCDEFLDERRVPGGLRARLTEMAGTEACLLMPMVTYHPMPDDDASESIVPRRIRKRDAQFADVFKLCIRGELAQHEVEITAGNHGALWKGMPVAARVAADLPLAHFYRRSPWQVVTKGVIGWLKVLAAGQEAIQAGSSFHYVSTFENMRDNPSWLLLDPGFVEYAPPESDVVDDPINYAGGILRFTLPADAMMKAVSVITAHAESLAQQYGRLIDGNAAARMVSDNLAAQWTEIV
jgi:glycosyltransferase involved in cell wall biosynthesis